VTTFKSLASAYKHPATSV